MKTAVGTDSTDDDSGSMGSETVRYEYGWLRKAGLDKKRTYRLELAVDEIATNIVNHGYQEAGLTGDVVARATITAHALEIVLEDTAVPFDPRLLTRPEQIDLPLAERPIGGLGVFLAIENVDEFRYEYVDGHNRNIFVVNRTAA